MIKSLSAGAALLAALTPIAASAQPGMIGAPQPRGPSGETVRVNLSGDLVGSREMTLPKGKSAVIDLPTDAKDVVVSNPKVADVVLSTPRRIYVLGVDGGQTDASFFDASGRQLLRLNIRVDQDTSALGDTLNRLLPGASVRVDAVKDNLVLSGEVADQASVDRAVRLAAGFVDKPEQVINMLTTRESQQVMLKVRIVEVNRSVLKQLGFNLSALIGEVGGAQFTLANAATFGVAGASLGGLTGGYQLNTQQQPELTLACTPLVNGCPASGAYPQIIHSGSGVINAGTATAATTVGSSGLNQAGASIQAFEQVGLVRTLAEPNLTAVSGESAKFLVGGEFPVPVSEDNLGRVSVEFKTYGVGLGFTPVVMSKGLISLKLSTEVSEITNTGGFSLTNPTSSGGVTTPGLTVPGLTVRRASTTVELPSGRSMMIAGLLQSVSKQTLVSLPGLMELPVLGTLFRSRDFQQGETELVVIITPYLVKPVNPNELQTPADGLKIASDLETTLLGRLNKSVADKPAPPGKTYQGPYGYVVE